MKIHKWLVIFPLFLVNFTLESNSQVVNMLYRVDLSDGSWFFEPDVRLTQSIDWSYNKSAKPITKVTKEKIIGRGSHHLLSDSIITIDFFFYHEDTTLIRTVVKKQKNLFKEVTYTNMHISKQLNDSILEYRRLICDTSGCKQDYLARYNNGRIVYDSMRYGIFISGSWTPLPYYSIYSYPKDSLGNISKIVKYSYVSGNLYDSLLTYYKYKDNHIDSIGIISSFIYGFGNLQLNEYGLKYTFGKIEMNDDLNPIKITEHCFAKCGDNWSVIASIIYTDIDSAQLITPYKNLGPFSVSKAIQSITYIRNDGQGPGGGVFYHYDTFNLEKLPEIEVINLADYLDINLGWSLGIKSNNPIYPNIQISPNPANDHIVLKSDIPVYFILSDQLGRIISEVFCSSEELIDIKHLPSGMYFYDILDDKYVQFQNGKLIKE